jgi:hypothetical protein
MSDGSHAFAAFMASAVGRLLRVLAGIAIVAWGWTMRDSTTGVVLMVVGLLPIFAGAANVCLIAPLIGAPFSGAAARSTRAKT